MWPFSRKKKKQKQEEKEVKTSTPVEEKKEPVKAEKKEEVKAPKKVEPKAEPKKVEKEEVSEDSEEKKRTDTYHVSRRSKDGKWQVKFGGSDKPIKLFDTQAEALDYAKELSQKYDKSVTIHKKDGKIRKQRY